MRLFGKKKAVKETSCCEKTNFKNAATLTCEKAQCAAGTLKIKVLGSGCAKCNALEAVTKEALTEMKIAFEINHVTDFVEIAAYGVMRTPALVVNEKVVSYGNVLKKQEVIALLKKVCGA